MKKKKLITSALPYVNNVPHLGNIIGSVCCPRTSTPAIAARGVTRRLYICGNRRIRHRHREQSTRGRPHATPESAISTMPFTPPGLSSDFNISFDHFGRTSTPQQTEVAQAIFKDLDEATA